MVLNRVNKIRLNQIDSDTLSVSDIELLQPIAESCPNILGDAVYWARGMLSMYQNRQYDDMEICMSENIESRSAKSEYEEYEMDKLNVFPNPASNFINIIVELNPKEIGDIQIVDVNGSVRYHSVVNANKLTVDTKSYPTGIYFIKYKTNTGKETIKKLLISK
jgi:hypothetical protein